MEYAKERGIHQVHLVGKKSKNIRWRKDLKHMRPIRIALTKGRLEDKTVEMLERLGYDCTSVRKKGRKLIMPIGDGSLEIVLAKAADVVTYVETGVCDMGVVGKDTIMEKGGTYYEIADLGFGKCRFALASVKGAIVQRIPYQNHCKQIYECSKRFF